MLEISGGIILAVGILSLWLVVFHEVENAVWTAVEWCMDVRRKHPIRRTLSESIAVLIFLIIAGSILSFLER